MDTPGQGLVHINHFGFVRNVRKVIIIDMQDIVTVDDIGVKVPSIRDIHPGCNPRKLVLYWCKHGIRIVRCFVHLRERVDVQGPIVEGHIDLPIANGQSERIRTDLVPIVVQEVEPAHDSVTRIRGPKSLVQIDTVDHLVLPIQHEKVPKERGIPIHCEIGE